jgi:hypothetical protein
LVRLLYQIGKHSTGHVEIARLSTTHRHNHIYRESLAQ